MVNLGEREEKVLAHWKKIDIYNKLAERNGGKKKFYYLDGPPNAYGLATHHLWVYTIKDTMLKYLRYAGYHVHDRPGFDVHGLPIENRIERQLNLKSKDDIEKLGVANFIKACKDYVDGEIVGSITLLKKFGVFMNFDSTYVPYKSHYVSKGWGVFKKMYEKGLLYKDLKPQAFCPHCGTVLSTQGPEVEYSDEHDKPVFVRYKIKKSARLELPNGAYLVIWTTTPWTLPSNMSIAANPKAMYVLVDAEGDKYIVAKERLDAFSKAIEKNTVILKEFQGSELEGTYYESPLQQHVPIQKEFNKFHKILLSEEFVTTTEGTGLLHVAPGHGPEDYAIAKANKIRIFSPIDSHSKYTADAGKYAGLDVPVQANEHIVKDLMASNDLLYTGSMTHSYPHCWRCHSKLIFRATDQWFIKISKMKKKMLKENQKIKWHPAFAQKWFADAIESSPDWCISRQRYWSSPLPIWICESCNEMEVIGSVEELMEKTNMKERPKDLDLHKPHIDNVTFECKKCKAKMKRVPDVFDVWYDSGSAHTGSLSDEEFQRLFPVDWITESLDQIRGWFMTLLRTSVGAYGKTSFKRVTIGGMMKDEFGEEIHRSKGNAVSPEELLKFASVDGSRLFFASRPRWQDLKLKRADLREANNHVIMLHNVAELVKEFSELAGFDPKSAKRPGLAKLGTIDRWILSRFNTLITEVTEKMDAYMMDEAIVAIRNFLVEDYSRFYLKDAKQRASDAKKGELRSIANLNAYILKNFLTLASIAIPFSCEYIYGELFAEKESIFFTDWPKASKKLVDKSLEQEMAVVQDTITAILASREKANISLRWPLAKATLEIKDDAAYTAIEHLSAIVEDYTNIKKLILKRTVGGKIEVRPLFGKLGPDFKDKAPAVATALKAANAGEIMKAIETAGHYSLHTDKGTVNVTKDHFTVVELTGEGDAVAFKHGSASVDKEITDELKGKALLREFARNVQLMRKDLGLKKTDKIILHYETVEALSVLVKKNHKKLAKDINASKIEARAGEGAREINIEGEIVKLSVKKAD